MVVLEVLCNPSKSELEEALSVPRSVVPVSRWSSRPNLAVQIDHAAEIVSIAVY